MGERIIVYRDYVRKPEVKRKLVRPRRRWEIILKWFFKIGLRYGLDWCGLE
jgi:hypothetical protein